MEGLENLLRSCCDRRPAQIIKRILDEVTAFANGASQRDDVTLMVVRVKDEVGI
jgi:serine phosphatase RsbU (regulator of sigma subunit)